ncbi:MAG: hypothetical protein H0W81_06105 [Chloroflexi bacterium]|nr:hypothetical protein [Chloroflexota bacterium]
MRRIEFEADTIGELVDMARRWVAAYPELARDQVPANPEPPALEELQDVLLRITSPASQQFLREVAAQTLAGEVLPIDDALRVRCGLPPGRTFVGVLGVANRTMRRRAGRDVVSWDSAAHGYRMSVDDARVVGETLGPPIGAER